MVKKTCLLSARNARGAEFYPCLGQENPPEEEMATPVFLPGKFHGASWATVHGVAKSWTQLSEHTREEELGCMTWEGGTYLFHAEMWNTELENERGNTGPQSVGVRLLRNN